MKKLVVIFCLCLALVTAGCGGLLSDLKAETPEVENSLGESISLAPENSSQPTEPEPEGPETDEDIPEAAKLLPSSISLSQMEPSGYLLWELLVEDEEELALVESLLSTEELVPFDKGEGMWPDGGSSIGFEICYEDAVITGACDPQYNGGILDKGYTRMRIHESGIFYRYPREIGDQLLEFLESKGITVSN